LDKCDSCEHWSGDGGSFGTRYDVVVLRLHQHWQWQSVYLNRFIVTRRRRHTAAAAASVGQRQRDHQTDGDAETCGDQDGDAQLTTTAATLIRRGHVVDRHQSSFTTVAAAYQTCLLAVVDDAHRTTPNNAGLRSGPHIAVKVKLHAFLPARRSTRGTICYGDVAGWLGAGWVSVRHTPVCIKTAKSILKLFRSGNSIILVSSDPCADTQFQREPIQRERYIHRRWEEKSIFVRFSTDIAVYLGNGAR